jgi:hypothetical protein
VRRGEGVARRRGEGEKREEEKGRRGGVEKTIFRVLQTVTAIAIFIDAIPESHSKKC